MFVLRRSRFALRWDVRSTLVCVAVFALTLAVTAAALTSGKFDVSVSEAWGALIGDPSVGFARTVVVDWRLPRALAAVVFGAALGASGAVFQSMTRNPLASPDIVGFTTGCHTGALVVIIVIGGTYLQVAAGALVGGFATAVVIYALTWRGGVQGFRLIVVGIAVAAMLGSFNTWLMLNADLDTALSAAVWGAGSLNATTWDQVGYGSAVVALLLVCLIPLAPALRQLELGDDAARATGTRAEPVRLAVTIVGVGLTATVTAAAGPIAFVALAAPQIARRLARTPGITILPAVFTGAFLLACADYAAQHLAPAVLPVGVVTVVLGGAYLVWLLVHEVRRRT